VLVQSDLHPAEGPKRLQAQVLPVLPLVQGLVHLRLLALLLALLVHLGQMCHCPMHPVPVVQEPKRLRVQGHL